MEHFNPILGNDTTGQKFITCGEIMLRLTPPNYEKIRMASGFEASYGGSEANIALALANLGVDSTFFSVVPNNSLGKSAVRWLRSNDVHCTPMILTEPNETPSNRLGTYYLETATASARPRSSMTASTVPLLSTISRRWIWMLCWTATTGCT